MADSGDVEGANVQLKSSFILQVPGGSGTYDYCDVVKMLLAGTQMKNKPRNK
jgi:hypothetical protein